MDFSIIIPAKNEERNIGACLDSIRAMDFPAERYEVLLVDNGSDDRTMAIAEEKGARVFCLPGVTISALRNFGSSQARGRVLAFLDADCTVAPEWLNAASRYLEEPGIVCFGGPPVVPADATWVQRAWFQVRGKKNPVEDVAWLESMNMFVRREVFDQVGGFNEDLVTCEDYDLSLRLKEQGRLVADQRIVAVHHGEAATLAHFFRKERWRGTSNLQGLRSHGLDWRELPSMLLPLVYVCLALVAAGVCLLSLLNPTLVKLYFLLAIVVLWQGPLVLLSLWKTRSRFSAGLAARLLVLFNVYFLARGGAMLRLG